jgi:hypothetical protein
LLNVCITSWLISKANFYCPILHKINISLHIYLWSSKRYSK